MLQFGLSVPVLSGDPVGLARQAEAAGFDFVSASDHPGLADPVYEVWTMLSWILAATSRIRVASRVLAVPFRPPALVAKMAATQSQLSGGRFILGLGAGAADGELRAYGLPVPTAGEKIAGLADAVAIARGLWSSPAFSHDGPAYRTHAADLAPKPAAPIPIWLGTFGPRALALTGRLADGWIPSYGYAPPEALPVLRGRIAAGARDAGRDPAAIDFIYHLTIAVTDRPDGAGTDLAGTDLAGPPDLLAERLAGLVRLGATGFSLAAQGPDLGAQVERLAGEVIPGVRALSG
jgi:alkanesulfonate monooxygenase SsuD/methylene tetrahydromethanopterin reductase-like flavin-dependent oxidoreductase (luciferase family)